MSKNNILGEIQLLNLFLNTFVITLLIKSYTVEFLWHWAQQPGVLVDTWSYENVWKISCFLQYFKILFQHYPWLWINSTWIMSVYLNKIGHLSRKKLFHQLQKKYSDVWRVHFISLHKQLRFPYPAKYQQRIFIPLSTISTFCFEFKNDLFLFFYFFFVFANYVKAVIRFRNRRGEN